MTPATERCSTSPEHFHKVTCSQNSPLHVLWLTSVLENVCYVGWYEISFPCTLHAFVLSLSHGATTEVLIDPSSMWQLYKHSMYFPFNTKPSKILCFLYNKISIFSLECINRQFSSGHSSLPMFLIAYFIREYWLAERRQRLSPWVAEYHPINTDKNRLSLQQEDQSGNLFWAGRHIQFLIIFCICNSWVSHPTRERMPCLKGKTLIFYLFHLISFQVSLLKHVEAKFREIQWRK